MAVVVIGAGVTGLTVALQCLRNGHRVVVLEKSEVVGGLCRSYRYGDFTFDIGPHRLFSSDLAIENYFLSILGPGHIAVPRVSMVKLNGHYHDWPLNPKSLVGMSPGLMCRCMADLLTGRRGPAEIRSLKDYVVSRYGRTIYQTFWEGYTEKFLGLSCDRVDAEWGSLSVARSVVDRDKRPGGLSDLLRNTLMRPADSLRFRYPKGGMGGFTDRLAEMVRTAGGEIRLRQTLRGLDRSDDRIQAVLTADDRVPVDQMVWTGSLTELCAWTEQPAPDLHYLDLLLLNLEIDAEPAGRWQWIYFPDRRYVFSRVSRPCAFDRETAPPGKTGLCVEITLPGNRPLPPALDALERQTVAEMVEAGLLASPSRVLRIHRELVEDAYPVYRLGFRPDVESASKRLRHYANLHLVGRRARFEHDNIDEAVGAAQELAARVPGPQG